MVSFTARWRWRWLRRASKNMVYCMAFVCNANSPQGGGIHLCVKIPTDSVLLKTLLPKKINRGNFKLTKHSRLCVAHWHCLENLLRSRTRDTDNPWISWCPNIVKKRCSSNYIRGSRRFTDVINSLKTGVCTDRIVGRWVPQAKRSAGSAAVASGAAVAAAAAAAGSTSMTPTAQASSSG